MSASAKRILVIDIESNGVNARNSDLGFVIVFGYKWLHEKRAKSITIDLQSLHRCSDKWLLRDATELIKNADVLVAHYGALFDKRFIQGRMMVNGIDGFPFPPLRDTCLAMRKVAAFSSNRLGHLARVLNQRRKKTESGWPKAWFDVLQGGPKAERVLMRISKYCREDVLATEELYLTLAPYVKAWRK